MKISIDKLEKVLEDLGFKKEPNLQWFSDGNNRINIFKLYDIFEKVKDENNNKR